MKLTKFVHSCLLIETPDRVGIIDPGNFSWDSGLFDINKLERLDDVVITHEHQDHMSIPFIQALVTKFPDVSIITTESAVAQLKQAGILNATVQSTESVELFKADHEPLEPLTTAPSNTGIHYLDQLTHPGDCHHFDTCKRILALPMTAPWGTIPRATALAIKLKPEIVIPIHDWHYRDEARLLFYDRLAEVLQSHGIKFIKPVDGVAVEL